MITRTLMGVLLALCAAAAPATSFYPLENFPEPAPSAFGVTGIALPNGRLLVWNGDTLFEQAGPNKDAFHPIATGYAGDPGFMALSPDESLLVLGAGYGGELYLLNPFAITDFTSALHVDTVSHYDGLMLTDTILLVDAGKPDFSGSELLATDILAKDGAGFQTVAVLPAGNKADQVLDKPPFSWSGSLAIDRDAGLVYVMDSNAHELRAFSVAALLNAFDSGIPLDWETDGAPIGNPGDYYSGGVAGIDADGNLIIDGAEFFGGPTAVQIVNPGTGNIVATLTPNGTSGFYSALYNAVTNALLIFNMGEVFSTMPPPSEPDDEFPTAPAGTPAHSAVTLILLGALGLGTGLRRMRVK